MLNYLQNGRCSSQSYLCIQPSLQSPPKFGFSTLDNFHLPIPPLLVCKIILTIPTKTPFLYTSATFRPQKVCTNIFCPPQPSSQYRLCHGPRELETHVRINTILISLSLIFLKVWTVDAGLAANNSLLIRLRKLVHCR